VLVAVPAAEVDAFTTRCGDLPWQRLGTVTPDQELAIEGLAPLPLAELRETWEATLPALFD
jgi:phosphoribosylformylglycinamidine synthase